MKILSLPMKSGADAVLLLLKKTIKGKYYLYKKDYKNLIDMYSEESILDAIDSIYLDNGIVMIPDFGKNSVILRTLEYGDAKNKSHKIISTSSRVISRKVNGEMYVF